MPQRTTATRRISLTNLHPVEITSYFVIWICAVAYSIFKVYLLGNYYKPNLNSEDFDQGWFPGQMKDISEYEWNMCSSLLIYLAPWLIINLITAELVRWYNIKFLPVLYIMISTVFIVQLFGIIPSLTLLVQPIIFAVVSKTRQSTWITWLISLIFLTILNSQVLSQDWIDLPSMLSYILNVVQSWIHLRCLSFCFENQRGPTRGSVLQLFAYCFYLPLFFLGPLVLFSQFRDAIERPFSSWSRSRCTSTLLNLTRYAFWFGVNELWLHLFYSSALTNQPAIVARFDTWALYGLGYCLGQFFMTKYAVAYGIPGTFARAERIDAPPPPKCIGRIHLYSQMWRTFDQGLYNFLSRYIYFPISGGSPDVKLKIFASFSCFVFVYIWHGTLTYILVWSILNCLGVTAEMIAREISNTLSYQALEKRWLSPRGARRFYALVASPLLFMSALSNFYFFAGISVGNIFVSRAIEGWNGSSIIVLAFLYCCCHISMQITHWEKQNKVKNCLE